MSPSGRPRSSLADDAILTATLALLEERGYPALSVEAVAQRAGVGKATVYRRFHSKAELVFHHLLHDLDLQPPPDLGSLRDELAAILADLASLLADPLTRSSLPGLVADLRGDPELHLRFARTFLDRERTCLAAVLDRAVARGELRERPCLDLVHALLVGPLYATATVIDPPGGTGCDARLAGACADVLAAGLITVDPR